MYPQLDSWWYFKGEHDGVKNWTAMPSIFPHGIEEVAIQTGWPIVAHNRYWSGDTDYAKQVCVHACVRACVCACVRACMCVLSG